MNVMNGWVNDAKINAALADCSAAVGSGGGRRHRRKAAAPWSADALEMSGGGGGDEAVASEGTTTIPDEIFNLVKNIIGAGVLSLPAGATRSSCCRSLLM